VKLIAEVLTESGGEMAKAARQLKNIRFKQLGKSPKQLAIT
jgi:hypothetical protein